MIDAVVLAIGVAMDATAVAAARGAAGLGAGATLRLAGLFGVFQAGMAAIGWAIGAGAARWIEAWDHWIALALLGGLGLKMLVEAARGRDAPAPVPGWTAMVVLAFATSIDALAAGVTLPLLSTSEPVALALIGAVTAALSLVGARAGAALGRRLGRWLEVVGGVALIAIGIKIVVDHRAAAAATPARAPEAATDDAAAPAVFRPLDASRLDALAAVEAPDFTVVARDRTSTSLVVALRAGPTRALVTVGPCLACRPMDAVAWQDALPELRQLMPGALEDDPSTQFVLRASDLAGHRCIDTWELGAVAYGDEVVASHAARLYCNDGATELVVRVDDDTVAQARSPEAARAAADRAALEATARTLAATFMSHL